MGRIDLLDPPRDEGTPTKVSSMYLQCILRDALETSEEGRMLDGEQLERIRSALRAAPSSLLEVQRRARAFGYVCIPEAEYRTYLPAYGTGGNHGS